MLKASKLWYGKNYSNHYISLWHVIQLVQQWPPVQKSSLVRADEEDDASGINLDKAREILQEEDKFDKEEYRKKIKEKHRVS